MSLKSLGAGSVTTADVRSELSAAAALPAAPHFLIRASHAVPLVLATLALDFTVLVPQPVDSTNGSIVVPINAHLAPGQALSWMVLAGAAVPRIGAFLIINGELKYLKHKDGLAAGTPWSPNPVVLRSSHLS